ncbi:site-2 protease family protein [Patescibacteria group bacterium AH-259-L07]|nr:site-2 protease family protein [Patescibacteria group bacterium AH-259-L07]
MIDFLTTIVICLLGGIAIHELGHIIALSSFGYRVKAIRLGLPLPPMVKIPIRVKRFELELHLSPYLLGGSTVPDMKRKPRAFIWFITVLAGPFANIFCLLCIYIMRGSTEFAVLSNVFVALQQIHQLNFWHYFIAFNITCGIGELIPFISPDGTTLLNILRGKHITEIPSK